LIVRGEVFGNVSVVNTEIQLYGSIHGNLNAVHSKILWNGGKIEGNVNLVLTKEEGKANVAGKYNVVAFNMPFVSRFVNNVNFNDEEVINGKSKSTKLKHEKIIINGDVTAEEVECESLIVTGTLKTERIECETMTISESGMIKADKLHFERLTMMEP